MLKHRTGLRAAVAALAIFSGVALASAKDTLTVGMPVEPTGLDPTITAPVAIREVTWGNIYEGLVTLDKDGKIKPLLATEWSV
ncbi:ABC transporter substrate-binding protein, partial [Rhizobiaceae sp. 2RAB30]